MKTRDISVDTLRGIACLLLVSMHVIGHSATAGIRVDDSSAYRYFTESLMYIRMPLFSFLAGFVYAWRPVSCTSSYPTFIRGKLRRLIIPFMVFVPIMGVAQSVVAATNNPTALPWYLWYVFPLSPYWFLIASFWVFLVVAFADSLRWLDSRRVVIGATAGIALMDLMVPAVSRTFEFLGLRSSLYLLTFFLVGLAASRFDWRSANARSKSIVGLLAVMFFVVTQLGLLEFIPRTASRHEFVGTALGVFGCLGLLFLSAKNTFLAWIGGYSSGIFLVHPFTTSGARAVLTRMGVESTELLFVAGMVFGIGGAILAVIVARRFDLGRLALGERRARRGTRIAVL